MIKRVYIPMSFNENAFYNEVVLVEMIEYKEEIFYHKADVIDVLLDRVHSTEGYRKIRDKSTKIEGDEYISDKQMCEVLTHIEDVIKEVFFKTIVEGKKNLKNYKTCKLLNLGDIIINIDSISYIEVVPIYEVVNQTKINPFVVREYDHTPKKEVLDDVIYRVCMNNGKQISVNEWVYSKLLKHI